MELLAPARDLDTLKAAFDAGADAVYLGLKDFSARKAAKNFSFHDFVQAQGIKKSLGKKVYVALNTLIFQNEIPLLLDILAFLASTETDAIIIQDYGVYEIVKSFGLKIPIHASTQMGTKNHVQANFLKSLGFKRVVLERQLSLSEITNIRNSTDIELEVFIHGALCFSLSGYCNFSKRFSERSGNRGDCSQPCRWLFSDESRNYHPFSMMDLEALSVLPTLKKIGINSVKIEGRMKGIDYVYPVVQAYRTAIDLLQKETLDVYNATQLSELIKKSTLSRKSSTGFFFFQKTPKNLIDTNESGTGLPIGKVATVSKSSIYFKTSQELSVGDTIRIDNKNSEERFKLPVKAIYLNNKKVHNAQGGSYIGIPANLSNLKAGSNIYLVHRRKSYKPLQTIKIKNQTLPDYKELAKQINTLYEDMLKTVPTFKTELKRVSFDFEKTVYNINGIGNVYFIPPTIYESQLDIYKNLNSKKIEGTFVSNPAEALINKGLLIFGSFFLYATNIFAINFFRSQGFKALSVSKDTNDVFKEIKHYNQLWFVWDNIPLCVSRLPIQKGVYRLCSKKDRKIVVKQADGNSYLFYC